MDDIVAFLNARLDQEEADVKWYIAESPHQGPQLLTQIDHNGQHMLREVAAMRAIVLELEAAMRSTSRAARHSPDGQPDYADSSVSYGAGEHAGLLKAAEHLAAIYGDHPDYRQEWKPDG